MADLEFGDTMMTIDEEVERLVAFLSHSCGFEVSVYAQLTIRPIDEGCPPTLWEVDWTGYEDNMQAEYHKQFPCLQEAAQYFVEKRRYLCLGADFEAEQMKEDSDD